MSVIEFQAIHDAFRPKVLRYLTRLVRIYQGQTTNFRTAGGGFAPVLTTSATDDERQSQPACGAQQPVAIADYG